MTEDETPPTFDREPRGGAGRKFAWMLPLALTGLVVVLAWKLYEAKPPDVRDAAAPTRPVVARPPVAPQPELTFRGRIRVGENDPSPVANARVRWMIDRRPARTAEAALRLVGEGTTDADGRFALPRPPADAEGYASVWCERPDGWALIAAGLQNSGQDIFRDRPDGFCPESRDSFIRMLVSGDGKPLAGARVELSLGDGCAPIGEIHPVTTTDARGLVAIHGLEGSEYWADISAEGFAPVRMATHQWYGDDAESVDEYELPRATTLHCRVVGSGDVRPKDAVVEVQYDSGRGGTKWFLPVGESGEIDIPVPRGGDVELHASAAGFADAGAHGRDLGDVMLRLARLRVTASGAEVLVVDESCGSGGVVPQLAAPPGVGHGFLGCVREPGPGGAPVAGARVRWVFDARPARTAEFALRRIEETTTAADGTFALPTPAAETGNVSLWMERPDGWHLLDGMHGFAVERSNDWDHGNFHASDRDDLVRVLVVGEHGAPIAGAHVELVLDPDGAPTCDRPPATTDARGFAELHDLESSLCWIDVSADGFATTRMPVSQAAAIDPSRTTIQLAPARALRCRVIAPGGALPPGTAVEVSYPSSEGQPCRWFRPVCRDGTLVAGVPKHGDVSIRVVAPGFRDATLDASADVEEYVVDLVPAPR